MVNNSPNINKTNNHFSPSLTEHNKIRTYDVGIPYPGLEKAQICAELNRLMNSLTAIYIYKQTANDPYHMSRYLTATNSLNGTCVRL